MELAEGFESAYGMELLASVHWIVHEAPQIADDPARIAAAVQDWTPRKRRMFTQEHVELAWQTLRDRGWLQNALLAPAGR